MPPTHCTNCGAAVDPTWRFCGSCGAALTSGEPAPSGGTTDQIGGRSRRGALVAVALVGVLLAGGAAGFAIASVRDEPRHTAFVSGTDRPATTESTTTTSTASTTTTAGPPSTPPPTTPPPVETTAPAAPPGATPPQKAGPEHAAGCLYESYVAGDRASALYFGSEEVVAKLFEQPFAPPAWEFMGCDPPAEQNYDVCWFDTGEIAGVGHGVSAEMTIFTTPSAGSSVDGLEYYG